MKNIIIWGAHSTVGAEAVAQLLQNPSAEQVWALDDVKHPNAEQDVMAYLERHESSGVERLHWVTVDYTEKDAGLPSELKRILKDEAHAVILVAQCFDPQLSQAELDYFYLQPLKQLRLLLSGNLLSRLHYLSSVFIAGDRDGAFTEFDFDCGQTFRNSFEAAQHRAEAFLRQYFTDFHSTIYRLPLVAGHTRTGLMIEKRSLVQEIAKLLDGEEGGIYGDAETNLPIAPVDHLITIVVSSVFNPATIDGTLHLTGISLKLPELRACLSHSPEQQAPAVYRSQILYSASSSLSQLARERGLSMLRKDSLHGYLYSHTHFDSYRYSRILQKLKLSLPGTSEIRPPVQLNTHRPAISMSQARKATASLNLLGVYELEGRQESVVEDILTVYWDTGEGVPVVLLSGLLGPESWFGVCKQLKSEYRCILTGMLGMGLSEPNQKGIIDIPKQAALLKGLLSNLGVKVPCHLVASDVAAPVLQYFLSRWPDQVASLTLFNPINRPGEMREIIAPGIRFILKRPKGLELVFRMENSSEWLMAKTLNLRQLIYRPERLTEQRINLFKKNVFGSAQQFEQFCHFLLHGCSAEKIPDLADIASPLKIVWSCENHLGSLSRCAQTIEDLTERGSIELIPYTGLDVYEELPDVIAAKIDEFISAAGREPALPLESPRLGWYPNYKRAMGPVPAKAESTPLPFARKKTTKADCPEKSGSAVEVVVARQVKPVLG
ncbi:SDR family oxidoreductase [Allohahella sp. A8]|uniref:SDR family oxidoreductase n=1 Tax=Allohahella sp. A8 TaxID=3141461 RepID=UPI003A7F6CCC